MRGLFWPFFSIDLHRLPGGGGGHSTFQVGRGGGGVAAGGRKPDPVAMRLGAQNIHPVTIYLTKKKSYPVAILHRRWCPDREPVMHKHCGLGTPGKQPCE